MRFSILWRLALRNLSEHRRRTITVGSIMALGLTLMVVGNAFLDTALQGVQASYVEKFTGNLYLQAPTATPVTVFGEAGAPGANGPGGKVQPTLENFAAIRSVLDNSPLVASWNPHSVQIVQVLLQEQAKGVGQLLGVDVQNYQKTFAQTVRFASGGFWSPNQHGLVLNQGMIGIIAEKSGTTLQVGDTVDVAALGLGAKIREVTLTGIALDDNANGPLAMVAWADIDTVRLLKGHVVEEAPNANTSATATALSEEDLFSGDSVAPAATGINVASVLKTGLGARPEEVADTTQWEFVTVHLKDGVDPMMAQAQLTQVLRTAGSDALVQDWVSGAGTTAQTVLALRAAFGVVILIIALVAIFIVMNALMISVSERTTEIGTMRALGGRRKFVRNLILLEVAVLALASGAVGLIASLGILSLLSWTGVPITSFILQMMFATDVVRPEFSLVSALLAWGELLVVALVAGWYPSKTALKLSPLNAIASH